jgi:hypothetical protein
MRTLARLAAASMSVAALAGSATAAAAGTSAPERLATISPHWTKISPDTGLGVTSAGLLRTADGRLHVVWPRKDKGSYSLHYSTVGGKAKLLATGTIVSHWGAIDQFPRLVRAPRGIGQSGMRAIFDGANGQGGSPYNAGTFYSATAGPSGTSWTLLPGSLSHTTFPPLTDDAATAELNGQPVTAWSSVTSLSYHLGVDPSVPAKTPDTQIPVGPSGGVIDPTLVTTSGGTVWAAWFNSSGTATMGYWVDPIFSGKAGMRKAPGSGGTNLNNNQPLQPVALATRNGGGEYLAYCVPTKTISCGHIALWRVGNKKALTVPGSAGGQDSKVALAAAPGGHLWVLWFDYRTNVIHAVRTNATATAFGRVLTIVPPAHLFSFEALEAEGSAGPLDIVALETQIGAGSSDAYFDAQILPALTLHASKLTVSISGAVTFTVLDSGSPVKGAAVTFLGKTAVTDASGTVHFTVKKGTTAGKHPAVAVKPGYTAGHVIVKVT